MAQNWEPAKQPVESSQSERSGLSAGQAIEAAVLRILIRWLGRGLRRGHIRFSYQGQTIVSIGESSQPPVNIHLQRLSALWRIYMRPDLQIGETYMNGDWEVDPDDLVRFLQILLIYEGQINAGFVSRIITRLGDIKERLSPKNDVHRSRRNVAHHYDIGNSLYQTFLDKEMVYSCAFFEQENDSLEKAQRNKLATTIKRLDVEPGMRVLDIGCGWGAMARALARKGAKVDGLTLSDAQLQLANARTPAGLRNTIALHLRDYRDHADKHPAHYDRVVSVGMFEHVGRAYFEHYFSAVYRLLKPGGRAVIHSIVKPTRLRANAWIGKYIFPGGYIPQLEEMLEAVQPSGLKLVHTPFLHAGVHYATTLRHWRKRFNERYHELDHQHYDGRFWRMWNFYLAGSQAAFEVLGQQVAQIALEKPV